MRNKPLFVITVLALIALCIINPFSQKKLEKEIDEPEQVNKVLKGEDYLPKPGTEIWEFSFDYIPEKGMVETHLRLSYEKHLDKIKCEFSDNLLHFYHKTSKNIYYEEHLEGDIQAQTFIYLPQELKENFSWEEYDSTYTIKKINATVEVGNYTFNSCVLLEMVYKGSIDDPNKIVKDEYYYAPILGLVKFVSTEKSSSYIDKWTLPKEQELALKKYVQIK